MSIDFLKVKPSNLPVYAYDLHAHIGFVLNREVYLLKGYYFSRIRALANQPLRVGDVLNGFGCYFGNQNVTVIDHLHKKGIFSGELNYIYGCQIDRLAISYSCCKDYFDTTGEGYCTIYIELSAHKLSTTVRDFDSRYLELTDEEVAVFRQKQAELEAADNLEYWINKLPHWAKLEHIGSVPENLIY